MPADAADTTDPAHTEDSTGTTNSTGPTIAATLVDRIRALAERAGEEILAVYAADDPGAREKADRTPVTEADLRAEAVIVAGLAELSPDLPVVAEEAVAAGDAPDVDGTPFWLVDPLDGTKEFLSRNGEFTVNIALVEAGTPVLGVVHLPAIGVTYVGGPGRAERLEGGRSAPLAVVPTPATGARALVSRSHLDPETQRWLAGVEVDSHVQAGSSLKFCRIAEGAADVYPRFGRTMEWDTAAGHAVLLAAGGAVVTPDGAALRYAKPGFANSPFVAFGGTRPAPLR
ncbi:3'(2'), 5'-bisphosphate nucleotidase [Actinopolymorpha cephalotaxi]|uniref:3'(2'),5'-bisphosphate nucleotidase CysQ n=1 Tax=Actinopolymorpha cephalotaxi TaxID=504797 RepID=A0A1I2Q4X6_9ACTN|nr:3'(2'),5'-bisphosphate nucleotidase CysQ [Actinopolymorpha cephalotaxi]NYH83438.1 3'(2'), 5'-bisphosphate nucleotidase [Actinopolymorpha cephalotaxi]SFG20671.1 3'(2'), 5'-bisphosphate nucleotidase [Actinopolymorpha cephalotaxi]